MKMKKILIVNSLIVVIFSFTLLNPRSVLAENKTEYLSPSALTYFIAGKIFENQLDFDKALSYYKQALVFDPYSSLIRTSVALILVRKNDISGAIKQLTSAVESDDKDYDSRVILASLLFSKGDIEGTKRVLEEARRIDPKRIDAYLKLSDLYLFVKDQKSALNVLDEMLKNSSDKSEAYVRMGNIYLNRRNIPLAIEAFTNALKIDPSNRDATILLSVAYELEENYDAAIDVLKKSQKYVSDDIEIMLSIGKLYLRKEDFKSARIYFDYAIRNSYNLINISISIASIYTEEGYYAEAEEIYKPLSLEYPKNDEIKYHYGKLLLNIKKSEEGINLLKQIKDSRYKTYADSLICAAYLDRKEYNRALECSDSADLNEDTKLFIRVESLMGMNRYEEARTYLEKSLKNRKLWSDAIIYLARVYEKIISKDAAISLLTEAINKYDILLDEKIRILYEIGMIYERNSRINEAIEVMKNILSLNPDNPEALNFIGYTYIDNNINLDQAKEMILKAYMYSSKSGAIIDSVGWMYYKLGDYKTALRYLKKAYRLLPEEPIIADHLADTYHKLHYNKEALEIYEKILKMENLDIKTKESVSKKLQELQKNNAKQ